MVLIPEPSSSTDPMASILSDSTPGLTVRDFHASFGAKTESSAARRRGRSRESHHATSDPEAEVGRRRLHRLLQAGRLQLIGRTEIKYLEGLGDARQEEAIKSVGSYRLC